MADKHVQTYHTVAGREALARQQDAKERAYGKGFYLSDWGWMIPLERLSPAARRLIGH